jgi:hypothetical protein
MIHCLSLADELPQLADILPGKRAYATDTVSFDDLPILFRFQNDMLDAPVADPANAHSNENLFQIGRLYTEVR